ncbi:MAG: hypothetical protein KAJ75_03460 [Alphaproteobacteria bacterium]|nr:hypothetical protein [Alphaproteobacteria bacterium]
MLSEAITALREEIQTSIKDRTLSIAAVEQIVLKLYGLELQAEYLERNSSADVVELAEHLKTATKLKKQGVTLGIPNGNPAA